MFVKNDGPIPMRKKIIAWLIFILIIIFVVTIINLARNGGEQPGETSATQHVYGIGDPVVLGGLQFVVQGYQELQNYNGHKTSGKFVVVEVSAKNIGQSPETVDGGMFVLWDGSGRKYDNNGTNDISFVHDKYFAFDQLNPGITKEGRVSFEVPTDATGFILAIRDNMFDFGGAKYQYVRLSR